MKLRLKFNLIFIMIFVLQPIVTFAKSQDCAAVIEDLRQMKQAQTAIQQSLVSNHEMMAQSLESYADAISSSAGRAYKSISENMARASQSLRERGVKAQNLSKKLETNTEDLIKSVEKCLK